MIRGHRRKGFVDPPKSIADTASTEVPPKSSKTIEKKQRSPSPSSIMRNKRLFDSSGFHDPKRALQPAKIRCGKMKLSPTEEPVETSLLNPLESFSICPPSPMLKTPMSNVEHSPSLTASLQSQQKQPTLSSDNPTTLDTQSTQPLGPFEISKSPTVKRSRRMKVTPTREWLMNSSLKSIENSNFPNAGNQQRTALSERQPKLGMLIYHLVASNSINNNSIFSFALPHENRSAD